MSTYERFKGALRANVNDLMERAARGEDVRAAVRRFEELAQQSRDELREARRHLAELELSVRRAHGDAAEVERRAIEVLRAGDEAAARAFLSEKLDLEREGREVAAEVAEERARIEGLDEVIRELEQKIGPALDWARKSKEEKARAEAEARAAKESKESKESKKRGKTGDAAKEAPRDALVEEALWELSRDLGEDLGAVSAPRTGVSPTTGGKPPPDELQSLKDKLRGDDDKKK